jgi:hypothetical protein
VANLAWKNEHPGGTHPAHTGSECEPATTIVANEPERAASAAAAAGPDVGKPPLLGELEHAEAAPAWWTKETQLYKSVV